MSDNIFDTKTILLVLKHMMECHNDTDNCKVCEYIHEAWMLLVVRKYE